MKRSVRALLVFSFLMTACDSGGPVPVPPPDLDGLLLDVAGTQGESGNGGDGGPALACSLYFPVDVTVTDQGDLLLVDWWNNRIRKLGPDGIIRGFIGSGGDGDDTTGQGESVALDEPTGIEVGPAGNYYLSDFLNWRVKAFDSSNLECSVVAGTGNRGFSGDSGLATSAKLNIPSSLVFDQIGNLYLLDQGNSRVRKVDAQNGIISTFVGGTRGSADGFGEAAQFSFPVLDFHADRVAMEMSSHGDDIYLADAENHKIRKINIATRMVTTVAGIGVPGWEGDGGPALSAELNYPTDLDVALNGDIYIADTHNHVIRKISNSGIISTVAGNGEIGASPSETVAVEAMFYSPMGVEFDDATNTLYIVDTYNHQIRKVINP